MRSNDEEEPPRRITVQPPPRVSVKLPHASVDAAILALAEDGFLGAVEIVLADDYGRLRSVLGTLDVATELNRIAKERRDRPLDRDDDDDDD